MKTASELPWKFPVSDKVEVVGPDVTSSLLKKIEQWATHFFPEATWVRNTYGIPSVFGCIDFSLSKDGEINVYEIDERPCGLGMSCIVNPKFKKEIEYWKNSVLRRALVVRGMRASDDEILFGPSISLQQALEEKQFFFVLTRNRPDEPGFHQLRDRSISTITSEGDKSYGLALNLWETAGVVQTGRREQWVLEEEPTEPCVFKPRVGKCSHLVKVFFPPHGKVRNIIKHRGEVENSDRIARIIAGQPGRKMYRQAFIEPMSFPHQPGKNCMYRFFLAYDTRFRRWAPLGGIWMASKNLIIQGSSDTVCGPLDFKE